MSCNDNHGDGEHVYFQRGNGASPEQFETVGTVTDMSGFKLSADTSENTKRGPSVTFKTFRKGLIDAGDISVTIESVPGQADWDNLYSDVKNDKCPRNYRLVFPTATYQVAALAKEFEPTYEMGEAITAKWAGKVSGEPTII